MSQRVVLVIIGVIILALMGAIFAVTYFSGRAARNKPTITSNSFSASPTTDLNEEGLPVAPSESPAPTDDPNFRRYSGANYALRYPSSWGILRCSNSTNYELDPYNSSDTSVACDYAVKPITVLTDANANACGGETVTLGGKNVVKSKAVKSNGDINYQWCFNGLVVSHRVSQSGSRATSKDDFSAQIEEMIASYTTGS